MPIKVRLWRLLMHLAKKRRQWSRREARRKLVVENSWVREELLKLIP
jgi:hypothetical protein